MKEKNIYEIIKKLVDTNGNKNRVAIRLGFSVRYVNKLIQKFKTEGKSGWIHKNSGRQPKATISNEIKEKILSLARLPVPPFGLILQSFKRLRY